MKKSEKFIFFAIALIIVGTVYKVLRYNHGYNTFFVWISLGLVVGALTSSLWLWRKRPSSTPLSAGVYFKKNAKIIGAMSLMVSIFFLGMSFLEFNYDLQEKTEITKQWPDTVAKISGFEIYEAAPGRYKTSGRFAAVWMYSFSVGGKDFQSKSTSLGVGYRLNFQPTEALARTDAERRPIGSQVTVFYNPLDPAESVLDRADYDPATDLLLNILGFSLMVIALGGLVALIKKVKICSPSLP